jgi:hypothetical protein
MTEVPTLLERNGPHQVQSFRANPSLAYGLNDLAA